MELVSNTFDALKDPSRPKLCRIVRVKGVAYIIGKVGHTTMEELRKTNFAEPPLDGFDKVLINQHPTRPLFWVVWVNKI